MFSKYTLFLLIQLFFGCIGYSQVFNGGAVNTFNLTGYSSGTLEVSGLPTNLDGITIGLESVEIEFAFLDPLYKIDLFLVAPDGTRVMLIFRSGNQNRITGVLKLSMNGNPSIGSSFPNTIFPETSLSPYQSLNAFHNQQNPNGTWRFYAALRSIFGPEKARINSTKLIFSNSNILPGMPNDECRTATALSVGVPIKDIDTKNYSSNLNIATFRTDVFSNSVGGSSSGNNLTENTAFYSFQPICKNDKITVFNSEDSEAQLGIFNSCPVAASSLLSTIIAADPGGRSFTFKMSDLDLTKKHYLVIDGTNGYYVKINEILWEKGDIGCPVIPINAITSKPIEDKNYCLGAEIKIPYETTGIFEANNKFIAQLSDANGTFNAPINIGESTISPSGIISATIPNNISASTNYKIRIVSNLPNITSDETNTFKVITKPNKPNLINGNGQVCEGSTNQVYSVQPLANASSYFWAAGINLYSVSATDIDSNKITINKISTNTTLSVAAKNECGQSDFFNKSISLIPIPENPTSQQLSIAYCSSNPGDAKPTFFKFYTPPKHNYTISWNLPNNGIAEHIKKNDSIFIRLENNVSEIEISSVYLNSCLQASLTPLVFKAKFLDAQVIPKVTVLTNKTNICKNSEISFIAQIENGGTTPKIEWYLGDVLQIGQTNNVFTTSNISSNTQVQCRIVSSLECALPKNEISELLAIEIIPPNNPSISISARELEICAGSNNLYSATISDTMPNSIIKWYRDQSEIVGANESNLVLNNINTSTTIFATITSKSNCSDNFLTPKVSNQLLQSVVTSITPSISINPIPKDSLCKGDEIQLALETNSIGNDALISWYKNEVLQTSFSSLEFQEVTMPGNYEIRAEARVLSPCATSNLAKSNTIKYFVNEAPKIPKIDVSKPELCLDDSSTTIKILEPSSNVTYLWEIPNFIIGSSSNEGMNIKPSQTGEGLIKLYSKNQCGNSDTTIITLKVINCNKLYIPNILSGTPSTTWQIEGLEQYPKALIVIYNRWGAIVHKATPNTPNWDGTSQGKDLPVGTYYYTIELNDTNKKIITGGITIVK
ncbi:MAG: gliding motility-associated C-terminal domain-containing protein [Cytophagales bacterium]|nr:MAG: gliding motility-associated C-terminal domain-containing protein [Cytophagales bacterium]